jgi:acetyl-CoA carboxylase biotin carboxyl carrier protein
MRIHEIRSLIKILEESDLQEIEVARWWGLGRVRLTKNSAKLTPGSETANNGSGQHRAVVPGSPAAATVEAAPEASPGPMAAGSPASAAASAAIEAPQVETRYVEIVSPMVGTFYRSPAPDADPYVEVGQMVSVGQTVCIVEAMKLMNEIEADVHGRIVAVKVENKHPVEYGQVLYLVDPS